LVVRERAGDVSHATGGRRPALDQIARAMVATSLNTPAQSAVYHFPEMMALNR
jgi:hypothetical protein